MSDDSEQLVDVNTEDLDAFEQLFHGKANAKPVEDVEAETTPDAEVDTGEDGDDENTAEPEADEADEEVDEGESEEEAPEEQPETKKNRKTAKERINELVADRRAAETRAAEAERRIAEMEARLANIEKPKEAAPAAEPVKGEQPDPDAVNDKGELVYPLGEFDPHFIADLTRYTIRMETEAAKKAMAEEAKQQKEQEAHAALQASWETKLAATETDIPDVRDKLARLDTTFQGIDPSYGTFLAQTIMQLDRGPEVLYYLANNLDEAQKIVSSGPVAATISLGRIEGRLPSIAKPETKEKKVSKAPTPPAASRGTAVSRTAAGDTEDLEAFEREFFKR